MIKSKRIKTILELKSAQEQDSLEKLAALQRKFVAAQNQVESLKKYRQDYQEKCSRLGANGAIVGQLLEFRAFLYKLDKAISGQEQVLSQAQGELLAQKKHWEILHNRNQSLDKIYQGQLKKEAKATAKAEQSEQDERASRLGKNKAQY